jgi:hypothetical protein
VPAGTPRLPTENATGTDAPGATLTPRRPSIRLPSVSSTTAESGGPSPLSRTSAVTRSVSPAVIRPGAVTWVTAKSLFAG